MCSQAAFHYQFLPWIQLQDTVTMAHKILDAFSNKTLQEQAVFQYAKEADMKEILENLADGRIEFYKAVRKI
jgi:sorting nexin-4